MANMFYLNKENKTRGLKIREDYAPLINSTASITIEPVCKYESDTSSCDLVKKLKEKQKQRRLILNELSVEDSCGHTIQKFAHLLKCMEKEGFEMSMWSERSTGLEFSLKYQGGVRKIEKALKKIKSEDIDDIAEELKALKGLEGKRKQLETIDKEILLIKASLGIE